MRPMWVRHNSPVRLPDRARRSEARRLFQPRGHRGGQAAHRPPSMVSIVPRMPSASSTLAGVDAAAAIFSGEGARFTGTRDRPRARARSRSRGGPHSAAMFVSMTQTECSTRILPSRPDWYGSSVFVCSRWSRGDPRRQWRASTASGEARLDGIDRVGCVRSGAARSTARRPPRAAVTFATTEPSSFDRSARSGFGANGRGSIYLAALSSSLIALAFIGRMSRLGRASTRSH